MILHPVYFSYALPHLHHCNDFVKFHNNEQSFIGNSHSFLMPSLCLGMMVTGQCFTFGHCIIITKSYLPGFAEIGNWEMAPVFLYGFKIEVV